MAAQTTKRVSHQGLYNLLWVKKNHQKLESTYGCKLLFVVNPSWENRRMTYPVEIRQFMYSPAVVSIKSSETKIRVICGPDLKPKFKKALEEILKEYVKNTKVLVLFERKQ
jgi:hypothetical protein